MSGAPIIKGTSQLPNPPIIAGITMKKDHGKAVCGDKHVVHLAVGEILQPRFLQFEPHGNRERAADEAADNRQREVHRPDVLVVGRKQPAPDTVWGVLLWVIYVCRSNHGWSSLVALMRTLRMVH